MQHLHLEWPSTPDKTPGHPRRLFMVPGWGGGSCPPSNLSSKQEAAATVLSDGEQVTLKFGCDVPGDDHIHTGGITALTRGGIRKRIYQQTRASIVDSTLELDKIHLRDIGQL